MDGCTDTDTDLKPPWRERKESYIAHLHEAGPSVRLVSAADKLYNARTILADYRTEDDDVWTRFVGGKDGPLWYYRSLANTLREIGPSALADELGRVVSELEQLVREANSAK